MNQRIESTARLALEKRPDLEEVVNAFAAFFAQKSRLVEDLRHQVDAGGLNLSIERVAAGAPLLTDTSLDALSPALTLVFDRLLSVIKKIFPTMASEIAALEQGFKRESPDLALMAKCHVEGDRQVYDTCSRAIGVSVGILEFAVGLAVSTVLTSLEPVLAEKIRDIAWEQGCCPVCGSLPTVSYLAASVGLSSEFLKGGGGQKYLHCSACGHDWRIRRNFCPACGNVHKDLLLYYQVQDETAERVDVCRKCGLYLPCIDLREVEGKPDLDMAAVGMVHLDAYAQQHGFKPMVWTPWNRLE